MQSITSFLSTAKTFLSNGFSSISKGSTIVEMFSRTVRNPIVIGGAVATTTAGIVLCAMKCRKAPVKQDEEIHPNNPDKTTVNDIAEDLLRRKKEVDQEKRNEKREVIITAVWSFNNQFNTIKAGQNLKFETNEESRFLFGFDGIWSKNLETSQKENERYVYALSAAELEGKEQNHI